MQLVLTGPVADGSSIRKGGATATAVRSKSVRSGPVSGLFPVHATGPLNTIHEGRREVQHSVATALAGVFAISVNKICKIMEIFE